MVDNEYEIGYNIET